MFNILRTNAKIRNGLIIGILLNLIGLGGLWFFESQPQPTQQTVDIGLPYHFGHVTDGVGPLKCQVETETSDEIILNFEDVDVLLVANSEGFTDNRFGTYQNFKVDITSFDGWDPHVRMKQKWVTICYSENGEIGAIIEEYDLPPMPEFPSQP